MIGGKGEAHPRLAQPRGDIEDRTTGDRAEIGEGAAAVTEGVFLSASSCCPADDDAGIVTRHGAVHLGIATQTDGGLLVLREVDKLDKRGADAVRATLTGDGFALDSDVVQKILAFVQIRSTSLRDALAKLDALGGESRVMDEGRAELKEVLNLIHAFGVPETHFALNLSIARGLDYYTGTVYETTLNDHPQIGSVCSGGRYENLAGQYTKSHLPGVGISIGLTRLYWQLRDAGLIAAGNSTVDVLVTQMDAAQLPGYLVLAGERAGEQQAGQAVQVR